MEEEEDDITLPEDTRLTAVKMRGPALDAKLTVDDHYANWKKQPSPQLMGHVLAGLQPTLNNAISSYANGNKALMGKARLLAAGAVRTYNPTKGAKLQSHVMTQLQPLQRHARELQNVTHVPERISMDLYRMNQAKALFQAENNREPSDKELTKLTHMPIRRLNKIRSYARGDVSESMLTEDDGGDQSIMYPGVDKANPEAIWLEYVHHDASPMDQQILEWKTGYNGKPVLSTNEIARKLGLTAGAVSQRSAKLNERIMEGAGLGDKL